MDPKSVLFFDDMLTPKIITVIYWLGLISVIFGAVMMIFTGNFFKGLGLLVFGAIGVRVWCELLIVMFKIHENIKRLADKP
jgi:hypothetical protein